MHAANDPSDVWSPPGTADRQFAHMLARFRPTGGLATPAEVGQWLSDHQGPGQDVLQEWITSRAVICFEWQSRQWLPWFQFSRKTLTPHTQLRPLMAELTAVHQPWEVAHWFTQPNPWMAGRVPVDSLLTDLPGVLHAACADRLIANGPPRLQR